VPATSAAFLTTRLQFLDLSDNYLTDMGTSFAALRDLCFYAGRMRALKFLSLHNNSLQRAGAVMVARLLRAAHSAGPALEQLDLGRCVMGPAGAEALYQALSQDVEAGEADLAEAATEAAAEAAEDKPAPAPTDAPNSSLRYLDVSENNLCGDGEDPGSAMKLCRALAEHPRLQYVNLAHNRLTRAAATSLVVGLSGNRSLQVLILDGNGIDGAPAVALANALAGNTALRVLSLRGNRIRSDGVAAFARLLALPTPAALLSGSASSAAAAAAGDSDAAASQGCGLLEVDLRDNYAGEVGVRAMLRAVGVSEVNESDDDDLRAMAAAAAAAAAADKGVNKGAAASKAGGVEGAEADGNGDGEDDDDDEEAAAARRRRRWEEENRRWEEQEAAEAAAEAAEAERLRREAEGAANTEAVEAEAATTAGPTIAVDASSAATPGAAASASPDSPAPLASPVRVAGSGAAAIRAFRRQSSLASPLSGNRPSSAFGSAAAEAVPEPLIHEDGSVTQFVRMAAAQARACVWFQPTVVPASALPSTPTAAGASPAAAAPSAAAIVQRRVLLDADTTMAVLDLTEQVRALRTA
jgi:hypothetical protein